MIRVWSFGEPGIVGWTSLTWREGTDVEAVEREKKGELEERGAGECDRERREAGWPNG
jgi:hypothetical protein